MNKIILTSFMIMCLLSISFSMKCKISAKASIEVYPGESIQEAIYNATDGDTIFVHKGTYGENVFINKSLSLVGEDRDSTIIDAGGQGSVISIFIPANKVSIKGFTVTGSGNRSHDSGILVEGSILNDIRHNIITGNDMHGIRFKISSDNVVSDNIITNNINGIGVYETSNSLVSGNTITNNYNGIIVDSNSTNDVIYHNNFNNTIQVVTATMSVWDYGNEGNYWSDYTGVDFFSGSGQNETGSDGIGDKPYDIKDYGQDNYPLMGMFSVLSIALEEETYHVTTLCNSTISDLRFEIGQETGNKIIRFNATGQDGTVGFCRIAIPTELINETYIVVVDVEEIDPIELADSNETRVCLYFTYRHSSHIVAIIFPRTPDIYYELLDKYDRLKTDLANLNATYYALLNSYSLLLADFGQLQVSHLELNGSYQEHLKNYAVVLADFGQLQVSHLELNGSYQEHLKNYAVVLADFGQLQVSHLELNGSYQEHLNDYSILLGSYSLLLANLSQLQAAYLELNGSYEVHLLDYSKNLQNTRNLIYIFAATTAIFIITTFYLSKRAHASKT